MNATDRFLNGSFENILLSQKLLSREKRHESYVGIPSERERCYRPPNVKESVEESCDFVWNNPNCQTLDPLIDLLPNSLVLLRRFKMKEYSFGAGVLALVFTLPSIMSNILTCYSLHRNYSVLYSAGVGKALHCLLLGLALICIFAYGKIEGATLMRDIGFTAVGSTFAYAVMYHEMHNLRKMKHQQSEPFIHIASYISIIVFLIYLVNVLVFSKRNVRKSAPNRQPEEKTTKLNVSEHDISIPSSSESLPSDEYRGMQQNPIEKNVDAMAEFLISISPFHNVKGGAVKIYFQAPFFFITALLIPVVRPERKLHGWCKFIFCTSFLPTLIYVIQLNFTHKMYIGILALIVFCQIMIMVFTHKQRVPKNHDFLALWGLCVGFLLTTIIEIEWLVLNWQIMNYVFDWTDDAILLLVFPTLYVLLVSVFVLTLLHEDRVEMAFGLVMGLVLIHAYSAMPVIAFSSCFVVNEFKDIAQVLGDKSNILIQRRLTGGAFTAMPIFILSREVSGASPNANIAFQG
ncbi:uncharacterized protein LOC119632805 [Glossina fuscipes]|uniref:Uncharacterized protein LOC119632805 n=1 Tax=Glossina fuscipes TaxID=7396 RepID=A0A8U0WA48_9MUSC|nr:uncharacterized protein LOC119632805 [Glossina fuscipes]